MDPPSPRVLRSRTISGAEQALFVPRRRLGSAPAYLHPSPQSPISDTSDESALTEIDDSPSITSQTPEPQVDTILDIPRLIADIENGQFSSNRSPSCPAPFGAEEMLQVEAEEPNLSGHIGHDTAVDEASEGMPSTYPEVRGTSDITPTANGEENQPHTLLIPQVNHADPASVPSWILTVIQSLPKRNRQGRHDNQSNAGERPGQTCIYDPPSQLNHSQLVNHNIPPALPTTTYLAQPIQTYLHTHYGAEFSQLEATKNRAFGTAYQHYTRYMILSGVFQACGLNINRPSLSAAVQVSVGGAVLPITHKDVMQWASIGSGNFTNYKRIVIQAERARSELSRSNTPLLTGTQSRLKVHLNTLAGLDGTPLQYLARGQGNFPEALTWTLTALDNHTKTWK